MAESKKRKPKTVDIPGTKAHQRYYLKDGTRVPGGSTIAKVCGAYESQNFLTRWANQLGLDGYDKDKYVDKLADVGTLTHARALQFFLGKNIHEFDCEFSKWIIEQADLCYAKFEKWCIGKEFEAFVVEQQFVSEMFRFGLTPDFYGRVKGIDGVADWSRFTLDWKTSKYIYNSHWYQVAGYMVGLDENGYESDYIGVLRMGRNQEEGFEFKYRSVDDSMLQWEIFKAGLRLYELQGRERKFAH